MNWLRCLLGLHRWSPPLSYEVLVDYERHVVTRYRKVCYFCDAVREVPLTEYRNHWGPRAALCDHRNCTVSAADDELIRWSCDKIEG